MVNINVMEALCIVPGARSAQGSESPAFIQSAGTTHELQLESVAASWLAVNSDRFSTIVDYLRCSGSALHTSGAACGTDTLVAQLQH